jgi:hypothetical protein
MSSDPENIDLEYARIADTQYLVRRSMTKGYQIFSILTPPVYIGFNIFRKRSSHITVNRLLRATWLAGVAGVYRRTSQYPIYISCFFLVHTGIGSGGAVEYVRSANSSPETLRSRRIRAALDVIPILALFFPPVTISDTLHVCLLNRELLIELTTMLPSARFSAQYSPPPSSGNTGRLLTVGVLSIFLDYLEITRVKWSSVVPV